VESDPVAFDLSPGEDVFVTFWVPDGSPTVYLDGGSATSAWVISGTDHSNTVDWEGLPTTTRPYIYAIFSLREYCEVPADCNDGL
jgi:hypothetical protein